MTMVQGRANVRPTLLASASRRGAAVVAGLALVLGCGGMGEEPPPPAPVVAPMPRTPPPPEVTGERRSGEAPDPRVERKLAALAPQMARCLGRRRAEIPGTQQPVGMSLDVALRRQASALGVEVVRSGLDAPEVVDGCVIEAIDRMDFEGMGDFEFVWGIYIDFP